MSKEVRCYQHPVLIENRSDEGKNRIITGYAAVFGQRSQVIGDFTEVILPGAFDECLNDDVVCLFNHTENMILARNTSKTLRLSIDNVGLKYEFDVPNTTVGNDLFEMVSRGDITHSSFSFSVDADRWQRDENGKDLRTIIRVKRLYDVSPVVWPAYLQTNVSVSQRNMIHSQNILKNLRKLYIFETL